MSKAIVLLFGFVVLVSGCIADSAAEDEDIGRDGTPGSGPNTMEAGGSGIVGRVISDELFPVIGATIQLVDGPSTTTDDEGAFVLNGVAPGEQTLDVTATGYEPLLHEVDVLSEGYAEVQLTMIGIPGQAPYVSTYIFEGFDACSFSAVYSAGPLMNPCPFGESVGTYHVEVGPGWQAGVHEMIWQSAEEMIFSSLIGEDANCQTSGTSWDPCAALLSGRSPLRVFAQPLDFEYAAQHAINPTVVWPEGNHTSTISSGYSGFARQEINNTANPVCLEINRQFSVPESWGCPFGVGVSLGTRFDMYHTTFYFQGSPGPLEEFTAAPDQ